MSARSVSVPGRFILRRGPLAAIAAWLLIGATATAGGESPIYQDGRLNPDPDEYYSLWCAHDWLEVWGSVPSPLVLKLVPIPSLFMLGEGASLDLGDAMTAVRNSADTMTIHGSNGNAAPAPGEKAFSLSECIARNGGLPDLDGEEPPPDHSEPPEPLRIRAEDLLAYASSSLEILWAWLYGLCPVEGLELELPPDYDGAGDRVVARARGDARIALDVFYAVRDQILAPSQAGARYRDLYDAYDRELLAVLGSNWGRAELGRATLLRFQPLLRALVDGEGAKAVIGREDVEAVELLLDHITAAGSPELAQTIADERARQPLVRFVGLNMETARAVLIGCEGIADPFAQARCALGELLDPDLCAAGEALEPKLLKALRKNVTRAQRSLARAPGRTLRKVDRLVSSAGKRLDAIDRKGGKATLTPPGCRQELTERIAERRTLLEAL